MAIVKYYRHIVKTDVKVWCGRLIEECMLANEHTKDHICKACIYQRKMNDERNLSKENTNENVVL